MEAIEIILLITGVLIFILSFVIPAKREEMSAEAKEAARKEIEALISSDVEAAKGRIDDIVDETVTYSIEKTERSLERLTNEKLMAVGEYADTVLNDIGKNHKEVMFLYDMLSDKQQSIKDTVNEVTQTVKRAEMVVEEVVVQNLEAAVAENSVSEPAKSKRAKETTGTAEKNARSTVKKGKTTQTASSPAFSFMPEEGVDGRNNNDRILELHKMGKSNVAIAKELGLGVGEVKLVIGLFEGM